MTDDCLIGKRVRVQHERKGTFEMIVTGVVPEWIKGIICDGKTITLNEANSQEEGETISVRRSLCKIDIIGDKDAK